MYTVELLIPVNHLLFRMQSEIRTSIGRCGVLFREDIFGSIKDM